MANCELGECTGDPKYTTPIVVPGLPNSGDGGGHEFVTKLPAKNRLPNRTSNPYRKLIDGGA